MKRRRDIRVMYMTIAFIVGARFLFLNLGGDGRKFDLFLIAFAIVMGIVDMFDQYISRR